MRENNMFKTQKKHLKPQEQQKHKLFTLEERSTATVNHET